MGRRIKCYIEQLLGACTSHPDLVGDLPECPSCFGRSPMPLPDLRSRKYQPVSCCPVIMPHGSEQADLGPE